MGLSDWIPGLSSSESGSTDDDSVDTLYLADETPWKTELRDYRLMIGPERETADREWTVYRCTRDDTKVPRGAELFVFQEGRVVSDGDRPFQLHLAQLVHNPDERDLDGYFVDFPTELTGDSYSEHTPVDDDELSRFIRSVPGDF
jgi:hypothetical protein